MNPLPRKAVPAVAPRPAATTLVVRDGAAGLEVLMLRRSLQASFMPGSYVFPGGAVDPADGAPESLAASSEDAATLARRIGQVTGVGEQAAAFAVAALRECFEECGLWLGVNTPPADLGTLRARLHAGQSLASLAREAALPLATDALLPWSHWVTPVGVPKRFDTLFFVALAPSAQQPEVDAGETIELAWVHPPAALAAHAAGRFQMEFATIGTMRSLQPHSSGVGSLLQYAGTLTHLPPLHPRLKLDDQGQIVGVLLPGQPGYAQAMGDGPSA